MRALDEESVVAVQGESSDWLWVMPGPPQAPQGAGSAGLIALEEDGGAAGACVRWPFLGLWERAWARPLRVRVNNNNNIIPNQETARTSLELTLTCLLLFVNNNINNNNNNLPNNINNI